MKSLSTRLPTAEQSVFKWQLTTLVAFCAIAWAACGDENRTAADHGACLVGSCPGLVSSLPPLVVSISRTDCCSLVHRVGPMPPPIFWCNRFEFSGRPYPVPPADLLEHPPVQQPAGRCIGSCEDPCAGLPTPTPSPTIVSLSPTATQTPLPGSIGAPCTSETECATHFCVDGHCCHRCINECGLCGCDGEPIGTPCSGVPPTPTPTPTVTSTASPTPLPPVIRYRLLPASGFGCVPTPPPILLISSGLSGTFTVIASQLQSNSPFHFIITGIAFETLGYTVTGDMGDIEATTSPGMERVTLTATVSINGQEAVLNGTEPLSLVSDSYPPTFNYLKACGAPGRGGSCEV
jgi:hypothetical protein